MPPLFWIANDPKIARRLKAIDKGHAAKRAKAAGWSLAEKLGWYRKCDAERDEAYARVKQEFR